MDAITKQPGNIIYREWNDGLFGCANDCSNCVFTFFCYSCQVCVLYHRYGECCCTPVVIPAAEFVLSAQHRGRQRIEGSLISECCKWIWCPPCYVCRLTRDIDYTIANRGTLI